MDKNITVKEISTTEEIWDFIRFPQTLYKDVPQYVPALEAEEWNTLTQHPALKFCDLRMWMAYKGDQPVGRIAGIINHRYNRYYQKRRIRFGWLDFIDDPDVLQTLIRKVEKWGAGLELDEMAGPSRFTNMEKQGMMIQGFDVVPSVATDYNAPYYPLLMEKSRFEKETDFIQYKIKVDPVPDSINRLYDIISKRYNVTVKEFGSNKEMAEYGMKFLDALNESFSGNYNFIPLDDEEKEYLIRNHISQIQPDLVSVLTDEKDRVLGFALCMPSLSMALQKAGGKVFPFKRHHVNKAFRKNDTVDLLLTGIIPEWQSRGIHALYHKLLNEAFLNRSYQYAITNPQAENLIAGRVWDKYDSQVYCKKRCYVKRIFR